MIANTPALETESMSAMDARATEIWKPLPITPLYEISNLGRVRRVGRKILKQQRMTSGYLFVVICDGESQKQYGIHQLVAMAFHGMPNGRLDVNHKDGNKHNNCEDNLEWMTRSDNQRHAADTGLKPCGEDSHLCTKLTARDVLQIRALGAQGGSQASLGRQFGVAQPYIGKILRHEKWRQLAICE